MDHKKNVFTHTLVLLRLLTGAQLDIQQGRGQSARKYFFLKTTLTIQNIILEKLPYQFRYFPGKFLYLGTFFSVWSKFVWENSLICISGANLVLVGIFSFVGNLKSLF